MKKKYETPIFYLEEFALSQAIATGCGPLKQAGGVYPDQGDYTSCGILIDNDGDNGPSSRDSFLFLKETYACLLYEITDKDGNSIGVVQGTYADGSKLSPGEPSIYDEYCYHNPDGSKLALFAS